MACLKVVNELIYIYFYASEAIQVYKVLGCALSNFSNDYPDEGAKKTHPKITWLKLFQFHHKKQQLFTAILLSLFF